MPNSTTTLSNVLQFAKTFPEISPILQSAAGGSSLQPALTICSDVMIEIVSQVFNWKWNRFGLPVFYTNSFQQDYALNVVNLGWLENGFLKDINNTAYPQPIWPLEVVKDLPVTSAQYGMPGQVCWFPNDQLVYGAWGASNIGGGVGPNPQPLQKIASPIGVTISPSNPLLQVADSFGNLWVVTTYGTTGATTPFASNLNPTFPTLSSPTTTATAVTDGSVVWTAVNPKGMGIRCSPLPPQTGVIYQFNLFGQFRPFSFSNGPFAALAQTIEPIPDDFAKWFRDGFVAMAYAHSPDKAVRGKYQDMYTVWRNGLMAMKIQGDRERDNAGFYPSSPITQGPFQIYPGPAYPFQMPY